jgi:hypothetical protein
MTPSSGFVGAAFYHSLTPSEVVTVVPRLLTAFDSATRAVGLLRYVVSQLVRPSDFPTKRVDGDALERLATAIVDERILSVDFRERPPLDRTSVVPAQLSFSLTPNRVAQQPVEVPFEAIAFFPRRVVASTRALVGAVSEIAETLGASYALVHAGRDAEMVKQEARGIAATHFFEEPSPEERERVGRLDHVQMHRPVLGCERIPGAYWGTFLAPHFVERLGGLARVRTSAPVEKVEALSSGMAYLQLTADVWDYDRADFPEKLASLERYLEPISLLSLERIAIPLRFKSDRAKPI